MRACAANPANVVYSVLPSSAGVSRLRALRPRAFGPGDSCTAAIHQKGPLPGRSFADEGSSPRNLDSGGLMVDSKYSYGTYHQRNETADDTQVAPEGSSTGS